jgi:flagellar basal body rod protein FlgG
MSRILGASVIMLLLLGCGQTASHPSVSAQPPQVYTARERCSADGVLAAAVRDTGGAGYYAPSHPASEGVSAALWDHAALTPALRTASESLVQALLRKMEILAYNVSNVETIGFKRARVFIETQTTEANGGLARTGSEPGSSPGETATAAERVTIRSEIVFDQGSALRAGNLDVMIQGDGFFQVRLADERIGYTRAGHFVRSADGSIMVGGTPELCLVNNLVIPESIPTQDVAISSRGEVSAVNNDGQIQILGKLRLARFPNQSGLSRHGPRVFLATGAAGAAVVGAPGENGLGLLLPGHLELSNADFVSEMLELATTRQRFDATLVLVRLAAVGPSAHQSPAK